MHSGVHNASTQIVEGLSLCVCSYACCQVAESINLQGPKVKRCAPIICHSCPHPKKLIDPHRS